VAVADDGGHSGHCGQFIRGALSIAAGDDNPGLRIEAMRAADKGACGAVGFGGYAAGIHDHYIGGGGRSLDETGGAQTATDRFAIGAGGPASEMFDVKFRHISSLVIRPIISSRFPTLSPEKRRKDGARNLCIPGPDQLCLFNPDGLRSNAWRTYSRRNNLRRAYMGCGERLGINLGAERDFAQGLKPASILRHLRHG
jgi:hypothetical protein